MINRKSILTGILVLFLIVYINFEYNISKADNKEYSNIQNIGVGPNFRIYPSGVHQTEPFSVVHPLNRQIIFTACNTLNPTTAFRNEGVYRSLNGGSNWSGSDTCNGPILNFHMGDPGVSIHHNGNFILIRLGFPTGLYSHFSTDMGINWSTQKTISNNQFDLDRGTIVTDGNPSSTYYGRTYVTWVRFASPFPTFFVYTDDISGNWSAPAQINYPPQRCQGAEIGMAPNGIVNVCWAQVTSSSPFTEDAVGFASSSNGGSTWFKVENAFDMNGIQGVLSAKGNIRVNGLPRFDVDKTGGARNGWIYIATTQKNLSPAGSDPDIIMNKSTNGGLNWSSSIRVNQDAINNGKIQYFPVVHVDSTGGVNVLYYDDRNTTSDSAGVFLSRSVDGGVTWKDVQISDHNFKPTPIGGFGQGYQGDNIALTSTNNNLIATWMDNSTGIYQLWSALADINTIGIKKIMTEIPEKFSLHQNYPNPFNPVTKIKFDITSNGKRQTPDVRLIVYDISGKEITKLVNENLSAGSYEVFFDGSNLTSGIYFYRLTADNYSQTNKMMLIK
jgi:hypothetical protein